MSKKKFEPKFLVNEDGQPIAVQLDIEIYEALLEELEDLSDVKNAEKIIAKKPKTHTFDEVKNLF